MRRLYLATSALAGVSVATGLSVVPAVADDAIRLSVGGFFKTAYMVTFDDDDELELGNEHNTDGFFQDAEVHFRGSGVADNGLEYGARIELEGETAGDQIDEAWIWFSGGFGEVRIGSDDEALANACIVPPGGTGNFSAFSPNQWGANAGALMGTFGTFSSNSVCTGVDDKGDAQKIVYITPNFSGFQLTLSYTPNSAAETHIDGVGPHTGMPAHLPGDSRHNVSAYATYSFEGEGWGLTTGLGGSWQGHVEEGGIDANIHEKDFYQAGLNLTFGNFSVGVVGEYFNDVLSVSEEGGPGSIDVDQWVAGIGAAYAKDAWTFGLQYSHREDELEINGSSPLDLDLQQDRVVGTVIYALGPGITLDGEIGYTWIDTDPEIEEATSSVPEGFDDYDALEIGIGTNFTF